LEQRRFEWDPKKAEINFRKHRVSFDEATTVWNDPHRIVQLDAVHSTREEDRELMLGLSEKLRLLVVIFAERHEAEAIRIISARRANQRETRRYTRED
jgi:uncharacterized protein